MEQEMVNNDIEKPVVEVRNFIGDNKYLSFSSFIPTPGNFGLTYKSAIHAYMSYMVTTRLDALALHEFSPRDVEYIRKSDIKNLDDNAWNDKINIMERVTLDKFLSNKKFFDIFLSLSEDVNFTYENKHHDNFWGNCLCDNNSQCYSDGQDLLGKVLNNLRMRLLIETDEVNAEESFGRAYTIMVQKRERYFKSKQDNERSSAEDKLVDAILGER